MITRAGAYERPCYVGSTGRVSTFALVLPERAGNNVTAAVRGGRLPASRRPLLPLAATVSNGGLVRNSGHFGNYRLLP